MERREFTRVIFLSSLARVSKLLRIIPFRICFALSNLYIHIVYTAHGIYSRDLKLYFAKLIRYKIPLETLSLKFFMVRVVGGGGEGAEG